MALRYKIPFVTLRGQETLTVNIYDQYFGGRAITLKGAAQPFETQEATDDDIFKPVRLQSGYLRIVDDGYADGTTMDEPVDITNTGTTVGKYINGSTWTTNSYAKSKIIPVTPGDIVIISRGNDSGGANTGVWAWLKTNSSSGTAEFAGGQTSRQTCAKNSSLTLTVPGGDDAAHYLYLYTKTTSNLNVAMSAAEIGVHSGTIPFNWRELIPDTDTDRPVTLTDSNNNILWMGTMQAQNFGATLYGNPQEREFPLQCPLTVTQGVDINYSQTQTQNFAYLLLQIINCIPGTCRPTGVVIQGGGDVKQWLMKHIDWQNFLDEDDDDNAIARMKMYDCLEGMCKFWGWTARTFGDKLYLVCPDDDAEKQFLTLTLEDLADIGEVSQTPEDFTNVTISDGFASVDNKDYQLRGCSKVVVNPGENTMPDYVIDAIDSDLEEEMSDKPYGAVITYGDKKYRKTTDILSITRPGFIASAVSGKASFNHVVKYDDSTHIQDDEPIPVIIVDKSFVDSSTSHVTMRSAYMHAFTSGFFQLHGETYRGGELFEIDEEAADYNPWMNVRDTYMKLGIGWAREMAVWWNGMEWVNNETTFRASLGSQKKILFSRYVQGTSPDYSYSDTSCIPVNMLSGYLFIDILGSSNLPLVNGESSFMLRNFKVEFTKNSNVFNKVVFPSIHTGSYTSVYYKIRRRTLKKVTYKASNLNAIEQEYSVENIFATENKMKPGYGVIITSNGGYVTTVNYGESAEHPEQHLADRIANYWASSKRKIEASLLTHDGNSSTTAAQVTPMHLVTVDGTTLYPISFSRKWRDDVVDITLMEVNLTEEETEETE